MSVNLLRKDMTYEEEFLWVGWDWKPYTCPYNRFKGMVFSIKYPIAIAWAKDKPDETGDKNPQTILQLYEPDDSEYLSIMKVKDEYFKDWVEFQKARNWFLKNFKEHPTNEYHNIIEDEEICQNYYSKLDFTTNTICPKKND